MQLLKREKRLEKDVHQSRLSEQQAEYFTSYLPADILGLLKINLVTNPSYFFF